MAARLPVVFDNQDEQLDEVIRTLQQRMDATTQAILRLPGSVSDQKAVMDGLVANTDQADRAAERTAYRRKQRRTWNKQSRSAFVSFVQLFAVEISGNGTTAQLMKEVLTELATAESKTLTDYLTEIGNAT
jgi:transcription termination factor NusB